MGYLVTFEEKKSMIKKSKQTSLKYTIISIDFNILLCDLFISVSKKSVFL